MSLDLRIPMGLMFTLVGVILTAFGLRTNGSPIYAGIKGLDINLWWGLVLLVFGLTMFLLGPPQPEAPGQAAAGAAEDADVRRGH
jgi:hypothetical protein